MWDLAKFSSNVALQDESGSCISYSALDLVCSEFYSHIGRRCLVFLLCRNTIGSVIGYVSSLNNRVVPVLLNADLDVELLNNLISVYKPSYIWLPNDKSSEISGFDSVYSKWDYSLLKTSFDIEYPLFDDLCLMLTTSGSTGSPKFVRQSYKNVESNARSIVRYLELTSDERPITTLPMNYTYGLSIINSHLFVGARILVTDRGLMQKDFWSFFKSAEATSFGGVPYTYEMLSKLRFERMQLPSLRYMTQAGGKLTVDLHRKFAEYAAGNNKKFFVMYGQCEATARMGYLPAEKALEKCGSMGIAIPGGRFELVDVEGSLIDKPDTAGELVYYGDNVTLGYAEKGEDLIKCDERSGVLHTGDIAQFDKDGFYYIVGRMKRFLKIFGNRINLDETERLIKSEFPSADVACGGVDDKMFIFLTDEQYAEQVRQFVSLKTGLNSSAFKVVELEVIPKNDSGKTLYRELEKYYEV